MAVTNRDLFQEELTKQYLVLYESDPNYQYSRKHITAFDLAEKMVDGLCKGTANKEGEGIKRTCKAFRIKHTYKAIGEFLADEQVEESIIANEYTFTETGKRF